MLKLTIVVILVLAIAAQETEIKASVVSNGSSDGNTGDDPQETTPSPITITRNLSKCESGLMQDWINTTMNYLKCLKNAGNFTKGNYTIYVCITTLNATKTAASPVPACNCNITGIFRYNSTDLNITHSEETQCPATKEKKYNTSSDCPTTTDSWTTTTTTAPATNTESEKTTTKPITDNPGKKAIDEIEGNSAQQYESDRSDLKNVIEVIKVTGSGYGSNESPAYNSPDDSKTKVATIEFGEEETNARVVIVDKTVNTELPDLSISVPVNESLAEQKIKKVVFGGKFLSISAYVGNTDDKLKVQKVKFTIDISGGSYEGLRNSVEEEMPSSSIGRTIVRSVEPTCAFYDTILNQMSEKGCRKTSSTDGLDVSCTCDHTTVFAVMMSANVVVVPPGVKIVSYITEITSIVFLIITAALLMKVRNHVRGDRVKVQICVTFSLLSLHVLNVFHDLALQSDRACEMVAVLMHYSFLCAAMWMLMEGITLLFKTMDSVMRLLSGENAKKFAIARYVVSFTVPFVIVIVAVGYGFANGVYMPLNELYKKDSTGPKYQHCWLSDEAHILLGSAVIPIAVILFLCFCIIIRMFYIVYKMSVESENYKPTNLQRNGSVSESMDLEHIKAALKAILVLLPVLGIPWLLGFFTGIENGGAANVVFMYLNAIINGLQGVFLFFVYCVIGKEVRKSIVNVQKKYSMSFEFTSKRRPTASDVTALSSTVHGTMTTNVGENVYSEEPSKAENGMKDDV